MKSLILLGVMVIAAHGAISNVRVAGSTNVQVILSYETDSSACTVEVSEAQPDSTTLVHDVNPALFPGADSDSRFSSLSEGQTRTFVVGRRAVDQAADKKWYSRALQTDTDHNFRIRCGDETATGVFRTTNIPGGVTYPWPIPQDPATGNVRWPSLDSADRNQRVIDPNYGTLIRRVTLPGDYPGLTFLKKPLKVLAGNKTGDWQALTDPGIQFSAAYIFGQAIDSVIVRITGLALEAERSIEVCLTIDGAQCTGSIRTAVLKRSASVQTLGGPSSQFDTWGATLWAHDVTGNNRFGILVRPQGTEGAPITIQSAEMDVILSEQAGFPDAGSFRTCAPVKSGGGFHCSYPGSGGNGYNYLVWIDPSSGDVRRLGALIATGWGGSTAYCLSNNALFDTADPNIYYCQGALNGQPVILKGTYTGNNAEVPPGQVAPMTWVNLTPNGIGILIRAFDSRFDPALHGCGLADVIDSYAILKCLRGGQDSIGWIGMLKLSTGSVVAAANTVASPNTRWCGLHAIEPLDISIGWVGWNPQFLFGGPGRGPFVVTLKNDLAADAKTATIQVSGEPTPYLMDTAPGDLFWFNTGARFDFVRIVRKNSAVEWVVERISAYAAPAAHKAGEQLTAFCNAPKAEDPLVGASAYWDFVNDPRAQDTTNQKWVVEKVLTGAHLVQRAQFRVMSAYEVVTPGLPGSLNKPVTFRIPSNPTWAGKYLGTGGSSLPNTYQSHASYENYLATEPGRNNWFVDLIPFIGGTNISSSVTPVAGTTQVFKVNGTTLYRDVASTFALCGGRQLKDVSPGPLNDSNTYSYCVGSACSPEASDADVFVSCPAPVSKTSACSGGFNGDDSSVCVSSLAPYGQSITQFFLDKPGQGNRVLTNALLPWHSLRSQNILASASSLPDGSWIAFPSHGNNGRKDIYLLKVPAAPTETIVGNSGLQTVPLTAPEDAGIARVTLRYGPTESLASSSSSAPCGSGESCPVQILSGPADVIYVKPVYQDADGKTVVEGRTQALILGGVAFAGARNLRIAAERPRRSAPPARPRRVSASPPR